MVFVGNIPYGQTEEQITELFSGAGQVLHFRLVHDKETGRPKGFGFAEFPDYDSAASAVRNLNDYEIMGRKLRVDFSNEPISDDNNNRDNRDRDGGNNNSNGAGYSNQSGNNGAPKMASNPSQGASSLGPLPQGKDLPSNITCTDAISRTLNTLPPAQLLDILQQMKTLATSDPARATELLNQAPQLSYAVFQALLIMGLVSPDAINSVLEGAANGAVAPPPPAAVPVPGATPNPLGAYGAYPGVAATATPPVPAAYAPPPAPVAAAPPPAPAAPEQDELLRAVMALTPEQINQLPEAERQQIMALRQTFAAALPQRR